MKKIKKKILLAKKNKYQNTIWDYNLIKKYYKIKIGFIKNNYLPKKVNFKIFKEKKYDNTFNLLKKLYSNPLLRNDLKTIQKFYLKYSINLKLKRKYDKKFKKISNLNTCTNSYIFLGLLILKLKINDLMKLNAILKITDNIFSNLSDIKHINEKHLFSKLLISEINLLNKIISR